MESIAWVTGADRGLGFSLCKILLAQGWTVQAGQYMPDWLELKELAQDFPGKLALIPLDVTSNDSTRSAMQVASTRGDHLDLLINNAGVNSPTNHRSIREGLDYPEMHRLYDTNSLGPLRVVESFLPLLDRGSLKRLCFVSSEAGSIGRMSRTAWFSYCMSKAALNMGVKILFNALRPEGYTFRVYHPGWMKSYMGGNKNTRADLDLDEAAAFALSFFLKARADEDKLSLIDYRGDEWPW
jgi:NAD(P)-dependent dehydrogenase (short-subunit alcohol dehydrogenase family)